MRAVFLTMSLCLQLAFSGLAKAEDFTGFYAGVNAGYAFGRERNATSPDLPSLSSSPKADERALPPSAVQASEVMRSGRPKAAMPTTIR
ncbi:hypothetical protein [Methylobacterium sp. Leaf91]|uniref:hypothetical protein n=1 Tax=Methylobacterium sp. Leaf91 TaxID=1736247 RepID=UPI0006FE280B|nr:hypothetical protein [Methylobacterium sp. Leaf91]KQO60771.1 hypothetical protein ASF24_02130 [Methylobacterium sp. Leaf86]KQO88132.1 hypothetical protein ASF32_07170 [Methylobacterium sp. Leaf91]